jgi:cyclopropane-fatty-acyl-phospholipid synthase
MNDTSIRSVPLQHLPRKWSVQRLAKSALFQLFEKIKTGSLIVYDGDDTLRYGVPGQPGQIDAELRILNPLAYSDIVTGGTIGAGEAYMKGYWSSPALVDVVRLFSSNMSVLRSMDGGQTWLKSLALKLGHTLNRNSLTGSRKNIAAHYDLGNEFFELFLDPTMMYSAAIFPYAGASLQAASEYKLEEICNQLQLQASDHLLEIGTGWGGLSVYAAKKYGCKVTTTTLSQEQYRYTCELVERECLAGQITVLCKDYRDLDGSYDKLVSIEMIEAVGHRFYENYFSKCSSLLKPDGLMVIQAITMVDQRYEMARKSVDFIQRYIFPGGSLPSVEVISGHVSNDTDMQIVHLRDITEHYADTLACWRESFLAQRDSVEAQGYDEVFQRMWEFYLCYCEGGFRERVIGTVQMAFAKPGYRFPR